MWVRTSSNRHTHSGCHVRMSTWFRFTHQAFRVCLRDLESSFRCTLPHQRDIFALITSDINEYEFKWDVSNYYRATSTPTADAFVKRQRCESQGIIINCAKVLLLAMRILSLYCWLCLFLWHTYLGMSMKHGVFRLSQTEDSLLSPLLGKNHAGIVWSVAERHATAEAGVYKFFRYFRFPVETNVIDHLHARAKEFITYDDISGGAFQATYRKDREKAHSNRWTLACI